MPFTGTNQFPFPADDGEGVVLILIFTNTARFHPIPETVG
jgi:hypothetical protein